MSGGRETAPVIVIGAGCIGAAIAYHLGRLGVKGVAVLEREKFAGTGSTGKCAGGIRQQFSSAINVRISKLSVEQYRRFPEEMGTGECFWPVGYLFLLTDQASWQAFQAQAGMQRGLGLPVRTLSPEQARAIVPELSLEGVVGATFCDTDGLGDPHMITQGFESRARALGATFHFERPATGLIVRDGRVCGARTATGDLEAPVVVIAAGAWSAPIAAWAGVDLPVRPYRRHCFTTQPMAWVRDSLPMIVDMGSGVYLHRESGGLLMGLADRDEPSSYDESTNWDFLEKVIEPAMARLPVLEQAEVRAGWAGLYETTPDHNAVIGPVADVPGLMIASGFSGHGFMQAPGVGQLVAEWIVAGRPSVDLHDLRLERFREHAAVVEANVI